MCKAIMDAHPTSKLEQQKETKERTNGGDDGKEAAAAFARAAGGLGTTRLRLTARAGRRLFILLALVGVLLVHLVLTVARVTGVHHLLEQRRLVI